MFRKKKKSPADPTDKQKSDKDKVEREVLLYVSKLGKVNYKDLEQFDKEIAVPVANSLVDKGYLETEMLPHQDTMARFYVITERGREEAKALRFF